jgi:DUF917 family protein
MSLEIRRPDISALALGSAVLGTGGGGNSYYGQLIARRLLDDDAAVTVVGIDEMDPRSFAITSAARDGPRIAMLAADANSAGAPVGRPRGLRLRSFLRPAARGGRLT